MTASGQALSRALEIAAESRQCADLRDEIKRRDE